MFRSVDAAPLAWHSPWLVGVRGEPKQWASNTNYFVAVGLQLCSSELGSGAIATKDGLGPIGDESLADKRGVAVVAEEAVVMPAPLLEGHEAGSA